MKRRQRQGSDGRCPGSFRTAVLRVWSVEPLMSLRPFHEIPEVKATFIASLKYYLTSHSVDILNYLAGNLLILILPFAKVP